MFFFKSLAASAGKSSSCDNAESIFTFLVSNLSA